MGADGRPYIAVRIKRGNKLGESRKKEEIAQGEARAVDSCRVEEEGRIERGVTQKEEEEGGIESLIREYQQSAVPDTTL